MRRSRNGRGDRRLARTVARVCRHKQAAGKAVDADEGGPRRIASRADGRLRRSAHCANSCRGDVGAEAAKWSRRSSLRTDGRVGMSPRASNEEGGWRSSRRQSRQHGPAASHVTAPPRALASAMPPLIPRPPLSSPPSPLSRPRPHCLAGSHGNYYGGEDAATGQRRERRRGGRDGDTVIVAAAGGRLFCVPAVA